MLSNFGEMREETETFGAFVFAQGLTNKGLCHKWTEDALFLFKMTWT